MTGFANMNLTEQRRFKDDLFANGYRMPVGDAVAMTLASLQQYGALHDHWAIAWSGGKDSTATLSLLIHFIQSGQLAPPKTLTVFYADTRQELPPLQAAANLIIAKLREMAINVEVVMAPMDDRFLVYILGRGVPPPSNTFRWCTGQIKVEPMAVALAERLEQLSGTALMITGVRQGESAVRDARIEMSCSKDGGECGQGWYQQVLPNTAGVRDRIGYTLAPLLHWRVCAVWDWLKVYAPAEEYGAWPTAILADAYGGDEAEEINARTGCIACPLVDKDKALAAIVAMPGWSHLRPLLRVKAIYRALRLPKNRLKKTGLNPDGSVATAKNKQRMGPLTFEARLWALEAILTIQREVNTAASQLGRPGVDMLNSEEEARIRELIAAGTWPNGWLGDEPTADTPMDAVYPDGSIQQLLTGVFA